MFKGFRKLSVYEKFKKVAVPLGATTIILAGYQGAKLRDRYNRNPKLDPPTGPTFGLEKWADKIRIAKDEIIDSIKSDDNIVSRGINKLEEMNHKLKEKIEDFSTEKRSLNENPCNQCSGVSTVNHLSNEVQQARKIKLIMLGDSLVAGVGNDDPTSSPVLPQMIAKVLSKIYKTDVEWFSSGVVGGTVVDLRTKVLPKVKQAMISDKYVQTDIDGDCVMMERDERVEYVVVIICGLNDWKDMIINFPTGLWPKKFKSQLTLLVHEIQQSSAEVDSPCRIFLPNLPLVCIKSDPKYIMGVRPLMYFVDLFCYIWDLQKEYVAISEKQTEYIGSPDPESLYATPGLGNVSSDGVHPSTQGYQWWAQHIAEQIVKSDVRDGNIAGGNSLD